MDLVPNDVADTSMVFLSGSLVEGFGNAKSDIDVVAIGARDTSLELPSPWVPLGPGKVLIRTLDGRRVDIEFIPVDVLESAIDKLDSDSSDRHPATRALSSELLSALHSLHIGIPLNRLDQFHELRSAVPWATLNSAMSDVAAYMCRATGEDAAGAILAGDAYSAMISSKISLGYSIDMLTARLGHTNPKPKWRARKLQALGANAVLHRYIELEADTSIEPVALLRQSKARVRYTQELLIEVSQQVCEQ
ncbi:hypothetical protein [Microbacterium sp. EST19A]|uniref:hypothetical protein n=1 Tax=Microbacterium sp. EST19A TaxID=2862681 RepID=UPI001CBEBC8B|nr:hypothetical protein [Microbacterium sp. EST19A]